MKKLMIGSALAALLAAAGWSALAQTVQAPGAPLPPPAGQQAADDGAGDGQSEDAGPEAEGGGRGCAHGMRGEAGLHGMRRMSGEDGMPFMHGRHRGGAGGMARMIDANGDNVIGDSEAAALADGVFRRLDRDASGDLDEAEFTTVRQRGGWWQRWSQAQDEGIAQGLKAKFAALDTNKNGKVSKAEYMAEAKQKFAAADSDKDGKVSPWEFFSQN